MERVQGSMGYCNACGREGAMVVEAGRQAPPLKGLQKSSGASSGCQVAGGQWGNKRSMVPPCLL